MPILTPLPIFTPHDNTFKNDLESTWVMKSAYRYLNLNSCISKPKSLKLVYIQRNRTRQIVNEKDVLDTLSKEMGLEVKVIRLENLKAVSQVKLFSEADIAFGVHGAGFVNSVWMMPYSGLFEIMNYLWYSECYTNMAVAKVIFYTGFRNVTISQRFEIKKTRDYDVTVDMYSFVLFMRIMVTNILSTKYALVYPI